MSFEPDIVIVGSGMAGVSAAFPLVEAGLKVLMLDPGNRSDNGLDTDKTYHQIRSEDPDQWQLFVGKDFSALDTQEPTYPKYRAPGNRYVFSQYRDFYPADTQNFALTGSLAAGGLSNVWGAAVSCFDEDDLKDYPLSLTDLSDSYQAVARRVGVSGVADDDMGDFHGRDIPLQSPVALSRNPQTLFSRYQKSPQQAWSNGVRLGHSRNAVATESMAGREACNYCGLCIWGCAHRSIYSARYDLEKLQAYSNFRFKESVFVSHVKKAGAGYDLLCKRMGSGDTEMIAAPCVILACGTIGSTRLVLDSLAIYDRDIGLFSNPMVYFGMILPERVGGKGQESVFPMSQLTFRVDDPKYPDRYSFGNLFPADTILPSDFIRHMPLSYPVARQVIRALQSSLILGNCFLSGAHAQHTLRITTEGALQIKGSNAPDLAERVRRVRKKIAAAMLSYGAILLPGGFKLTQPGADMHYAGTLPMRDNPAPHELTPAGEVKGLPGVYVVDGAALTTLPGKPHSFTIMANADRIAKKLAGTLQSV